MALLSILGSENRVKTPDPLRTPGILRNLVYPMSSTKGIIFMTPEDAPVDPTCERRVQAVLALFRGEPVTQVSTRYRLCRRDLYKFRQRALVAMREALGDRRRGPKRPSNRLSPE